jgi:hypothetical protein
VFYISICDHLEKLLDIAFKEEFLELGSGGSPLQS